MDSGQRPKGADGGGEQDMFLVPEVRQSIPPIEEVPETQEEKRERKLIRIAIASVVTLILLVLAAVGYFSYRAYERSSAVAAAGQNGQPADLERALRHLSDSGLQGATRARLVAELAFHGVRPPAEAEESLKRNAGGDEAKAETAVGEVYLALAQGDAQRASRVASTLVPKGPLAAEAARVRALAALAVANPAVAVGEAKTAFDAAPSSPRHAALYAKVLASVGNTQEASKVLEAFVRDGEVHPAIRLARSHGRARGGEEELVALVEEAAALEKGESNSPRQRSWATLLRGRALRSLGDVAGSRAALEAAKATPPPGDEHYLLELAAGYLAVGMAPAAQEILALPASGLANPILRKQLEAESHVLADRRDQAQRLISSLPASAYSAFLSGRLSMHRQDWDHARESLKLAQTEPRLSVRATLAAAAVEVATDRFEAALALLRPLREAHPNNPEVSAALVDALRKAGQAGRADELLANVFKDGNAFLLSAKARSLAAKSKPAEALVMMQAAVERDPHDPGRLTELAVLSRRNGNDGEARKAFEQALELRPRFPGALTGLLELELSEARPEAAIALVERIGEAQLESLAIEIMRARAFVLASYGAAGARAVRRGIRRHGDSLELYRALGDLYFQAEEYDNATSSYARALRTIPEDAEPDRGLQLMQALAYARARRSAPAERILEDLPRELAPELEVIRMVVQGRIALVDKQKARVRERARAALRLDDDYREAVLLMADDARSRDQFEPELEYLQQAAKLIPVPPEALGRIALRSSTPIDQRCAYRARYLSAAPRGAIAQQLRQQLRNCRR